MEWVTLLPTLAAEGGSTTNRSSSPPASLNERRAGTKRRRPFFKPMDSGVLNYQEDFVMPGSSPR